MVQLVPPLPDPVPSRSGGVDPALAGAVRSVDRLLRSSIRRRAAMPYPQEDLAVTGSTTGRVAGCRRYACRSDAPRGRWVASLGEVNGEPATRFPSRVR